MKLFKSSIIGATIMCCLLLMSFSTDETVRPKSGLSGNYTTELSLSSLRTLNDLILRTNERGAVVRSYRLILAPKEGYAFMKKMNGNTLSSGLRFRMQRLKIGDRVLFDEVMAEYPNSLKTFCKPAQYVIIE
ncbi:MAG: hypothetical protein ACI9UJ_000474 [bacterium]|jgi:hypothetical protein